DLVDHADADHLADERGLAWTALEQGHVGCATIDASLLQGALHHLELVGPVAELAQFAVRLAIEHPHALLAFRRQTEPFEGLEPADAQRLLYGVALVGGGDHKYSLFGAGQE